MLMQYDGKKEEEYGHKRIETRSGAVQCYSRCWSNHYCSNPGTTIEKLGTGYLQFPNLTHACLGFCLP